MTLCNHAWQKQVHPITHETTGRMCFRYFKEERVGFKRSLAPQVAVFVTGVMLAGGAAFHLGGVDGCREQARRVDEVERNMNRVAERLGIEVGR